ncbi:MAG: polysaccharide biosynthesis C-terminal domain-containing protein, partial [Romboutsia timonensis]
VLPCAFGLAALSTPIMNLLYPSETGAIGSMLFACAPSAIFLGLIYAQNGILQGMGKPMVPVIALAIGMVFKVVLSYTLTGIPSINIFGSAVGTLAAYGVASLIEFLYIKKHLNMKFSKKEFIIKPLLTVTTMFVVVKICYALTFKVLASNAISTLLSIMVGGIVYVVVLLAIGGMRKEEILMMPKGEKIYRMLKKLKLMS